VVERQTAVRHALSDRHGRRTCLCARALLVLLFVCSTGLRPLRAQDLPVAVGYVNDFAEVLDPGQRTALEAELDALEQATSAEVEHVELGQFELK
jgi:uncharacterized membrane protein YgcG